MCFFSSGLVNAQRSSVTLEWNNPKSFRCLHNVQFAEARPVPAAYFRAFWPRFARIGEDVGRCTYVVEQLVVLRSAIRARPAPQPVALKAAKHFAHKALGILHKNDCDDGGGFV